MSEVQYIIIHCTHFGLKRNEMNNTTTLFSDTSEHSGWIYLLPPTAFFSSGYILGTSPGFLWFYVYLKCHQGDHLTRVLHSDADPELRVAIHSTLGHSLISKKRLRNPFVHQLFPQGQLGLWNGVLLLVSNGPFRLARTTVHNLTVQLFIWLTFTGVSNAQQNLTPILSLRALWVTPASLRRFAYNARSRCHSLS